MTVPLEIDPLVALELLDLLVAHPPKEEVVDGKWQLSVFDVSRREYVASTDRKLDAALQTYTRDVEKLTELATAEITISDIHVTIRKERVPLRCPHCKADIRKNLRVWEYQDQGRDAEIANDGDADDPAKLVVQDILDAPVPEGGENFIGYVHVGCGSCGFILAEGHSTVEQAK